MLPAAPLRRARLLVAGLWAVSVCTVAIGASVLNAVMSDRAEFGRTVSGLFKAEAFLALACVAVIFLLIGADKTLDHKGKWPLFILTIVGLVGVVGYFYLQPMLAALRATAPPGGVMAAEVRQQFGMLHGVSLVLYLMQAVSAVMLVLKNR